MENGQGTWQTAAFQLQVDFSKPQQGLRDIRVQGQAVHDALLQVQLPGGREHESVVDSYVRQSDLVVTYSQSPDRTVRPQLIWRCLRDGETRFGVELVLSMQTSLLDSQPEAWIVNRFGGELLALEQADSSVACRAGQTFDKPVTLLHRPLASAWSSLVAVYPADFQELRIADSDGQLQASFRLFPESLEKGVIRRARLRGIFVPREDDEALARASAAELAGGD
jgi:hypothetical protein